MTFYVCINPDFAYKKRQPADTPRLVLPTSTIFDAGCLAMIATCYPTIVREVCEDYAHYFAGTKLTFGPLSSLFAFSVLGIGTISEGVRIFPSAPSVSVLTDAIKDFNALPFMKKARKIVKKALEKTGSQDRFIYVIDDTHIPKAGKDMYAVGHWQTSKKNSYFGRKLLVLTVVDVKIGVAYPVAFRFCMKKDMPAYKPAHELALDLLDEAISSDLPKLPLVADSGFDCVSLIKGCRERGIHIYVELKSNRKVRHATARTVPKKKLKTYFKSGERPPVQVEVGGKKRKTKYVCAKHAYISELRSPVTIAAVFNARVGMDIYGYFLTTDRRAGGAKIWLMSRARWAIECMFRDLKQEFALGKLPGRSRADAEISICIPFALYIHVRLQQTAEKESRCLPRLETVGVFTSALKETCLQKSIRTLTNTNNRDLLNRIRARRSTDGIRYKPVNARAGTHQEPKVEAA